MFEEYAKLLKRQFKSVKLVSDEELKKVTREFAKILKDILANTALTENDSHNYKNLGFLDKGFEYQIQRNKSGGARVTVSFKRDLVTRTSWYPEGSWGDLGNQIYLPMIYNNGMDASDEVWCLDNDGNRVYSNPHRHAYQFMQQAKEDFMKRHPDYDVILNEIYEEGE